MKVLWFTPTPSLAEDYLNNKPMNGGWIKSLEKEMQHKVDLSIAFYHEEQIPFFKIDKSTYYPVFNGNSGFISKIQKRLLNKIEPNKDISKFIDIIEKTKPDIIHIHGTEGPFGLLQKKTEVPTVISIQGNISVCNLKFFTGIPKFDVFKYSKIKSWIFFHTYLHHFMRYKKQAKRENNIFKISKNFIGRTNWDRRIIKVLSPNANYYHNDEVLKEIFYEGKWQKKLGKTLKLFTTSGPNLFKGLETLIYCAYLLDQINLPFIWEVAGISKNDDFVQIASKSVRKKISKSINFLGQLNDNQIKKSLLNTNIYVAISHIENSPNSLCEALILGVPCIATYAGGTSSLIEDGNNGVLIQDGDPYVMAGAIIELKQNYDLAINIGANASEKALIKHDRNKITDDLLGIYNNIIRKTQ